MYMKQILNFFLHTKVSVLLISAFIFSVLYLLLDDSHFSGVNYIKETIKKEVIKKKIDKQIKNTDITEPMSNNNYTKQFEDIKRDVAIEDAAKYITKEVDIDDLKEDKINISILQRYFNRIYFSINTSCLLGYGDIYPISNISKCLTMIQSLLTISIIVY
tara:strand:- start:106 stop:585 length:480 start_codon:yes stop_codon:yes gene_type:complete